MLCCERNPLDKEQITPRGRTRQALAWNRDLSPVSTYCAGELAGDERRAFEELRARNRDLRAQLGIACSSTTVPEVPAQVQQHLDALRVSVAVNARLRADIVRLQAEYTEQGKVHSGLARSSSCASLVPTGSNGLSGGAAPSKEGESMHEREAAAVMEEIQIITQANIELISRYDEQVRVLEGDIVTERRRRQTAETELRVPASMRSLSPMRSTSPLRTLSPMRSGFSVTYAGDDTASIVTTQESQADALLQQRLEVQSAEDECAKLANELQALTAAQQMMEARALQELQMAHQVQLEEIEHFRRLVDEKRVSNEGGRGAPSPAADPKPPPPNTGALLEAELEQLQQHLAQVQQKGDEERRASEALASDLRRETKELLRQLDATAVEKQACLRELEEAKLAGGSAVPASALEHEREEGEAIFKEVARTRTRIAGWESKIEQLEQDAKDLGERASFVLRAVPDAQGQDASPEASARIAELQQLVQERQRQLDESKRREGSIRTELDMVDQALQAAKVEAAVMEQKMRLLKSRTAPPPTS